MSTTTDRAMTATERAALGYLAERYLQAIGAESVASWIHRSLEKTVGSLRALERRRLVRYFPDHPGTWSVTAAGRRELER
jgi:hypothetical protein